MFNYKRTDLLFVLLLFCLFFLSACGPSPEEQAATAAAQTSAAATSTPNITPTYTPTTLPTATNIPVPSDTPQPTLTPTPSAENIDGPKFPYYMVWPAYSPTETWERFPIHPDTVKGQEYMGGYIYSTYQTVKVLKEFYLSMLGEMGWHLSKIGEAEDGSLILIFQNEVDEISITILNYGVEFIDPGLGKLPPRSVFLK